ncbi:MAG: CRTAC1 family protein [Verrucomicrobiae bacterium]|nr:CRTAC1 family protein [Verrucomicrobiae bacterium]
MRRLTFGKIGMLLMSAGGGVLLGLGWWWERRGGEEGAAGKGLAGPGRSVIEEYLQLEAARRERDATIWAPEVDALRHEEVWMDLWDRLRREADGVAILGGVGFERLELGKPGLVEEVGHGISVRRTGAPGRSLDPAAWRGQLEDWRRRGYRLEQSEWRQPGFWRDTDGVAHSVMAMTLHIGREDGLEAIAVEGELRVRWREDAGTGVAPEPAWIDGRNLKIVARGGVKPFRHLAGPSIDPHPSTGFIDPLILYDLDGDGLSEILLPGRNLVYWNRGGGRLERGVLRQGLEAAIQAAVVADFNGDGHADLLGVDAEGVWMWAGDADGQFRAEPRVSRFTRERLWNPMVVTAGDVDGDGDLDLWIGQYKLPYVEGQMPTPYYDANDGFPAYYLENDGEGGFTDRTEAAGLGGKRFRRTYSASFVDVDGDGDLDLVVVSDFAGVDLYLNDGQGRFTDVTAGVFDVVEAFGMAHALADFDGDGQLDLLMIGMDSAVARRMDGLGLGPPGRVEEVRRRPRMAYGNRFYVGDGGRFRMAPFADGVARTGWSWGVTAFDFDNDGDLDLYVVNGHQSRASARDYESLFWRHDLFEGDSGHNAARDLCFRAAGSERYGAGVSYGGYHKNRLLRNRGGGVFQEVGFPMGVALELDCRNLVSDDLDGDGRLDLVTTRHRVWPGPDQGLHVFENRLATAGNWIGVRLREGGGGRSPVGARVTVEAEGRRWTRWLVVGDSYRSQHAPTAHFGLGTAERVTRIEVRWPNGEIQWLESPALGRYHPVAKR